ncbi:DUF6653 family protein [Labrenzia sp. OB1]|uniref:DUF6653 family protein n=1 Tax=Labrenzia sp. OB1 TaxID=1561204 RepID=UPI0007B2224E|nr:DUF6653 family protein [Labrenzia sp. OB1]KZM48322.1 hypothetical protein OA90_21540 [Labrenzia sp. OB1]
MQPSQLQIPPRTGPGQSNAFGTNTRLLLSSGGAGKSPRFVSPYVKLAAPALVTGALWSHLWIGHAVAVLLTIVIAAVLLLIPKPSIVSPHRNGWTKLVGFGERIWLNRLLVAVPQGLNRRLTTLYLVFWSGTFVAVLGGFTASPILTSTGLLVAYCAQIIGFQKLIQLYRVMKDRDPLYRSWSLTAENDNQHGAPERRTNSMN